MVVLVFIFGIIIGSFLNVVIYRIPKGMSIVMPPSNCPICHTHIKPWHNIPIISWIILKGKCAYCQSKIPIRYPLIELLSGIIAVLIYLKLQRVDIFFLIDFSIFASLLALSVIDLDYKAVPDSLNLLVLTLSFFSSADFFENFTNALILMGGMSALRFYLSYFIKKEAMGEGDIIVAGSMGGLLGIKLSLVALFIASLIALFPSFYMRVKNKELELPFVPFLALATFIVWYFDTFFLKCWSLIYG